MAEEGFCDDGVVVARWEACGLGEYEVRTGFGFF